MRVMQSKLGLLGSCVLCVGQKQMPNGSFVTVGLGATLNAWQSDFCRQAPLVKLSALCNTGHPLAGATTVIADVMTALQVLVYAFAVTWQHPHDCVHHKEEACPRYPAHIGFTGVCNVNKAVVQTSCVVNV